MSQASITAPELPDTLEWVNIDNRVLLSELRGKIVILNIWSSGSISCKHVLDDLRFLESKYREELVVIGIHSPKFPHENNLDNVRKSINKLHIRHPVAHDSIMRVWKKYRIQSWPTLVLIDAAGHVIGTVRGEGHRKQLDQLVQKYVDQADSQQILQPGAVHIRPKSEPVAVLNFPGKLLAVGAHVYISDSGHNRVIVMNEHGRVTRVFGSGTPGLIDGVATETAFDNPQGLARLNNFLYVADTGNHAIRRINLETDEVWTIAGDGRPGQTSVGDSINSDTVRLNSPWGLCFFQNILFITMAGQHQIWRWDLGDNRLSILAGSGEQNLADGAAHDAMFAQPSGICAGDHCLYVADAGSSAIRQVRLPDGQVSTLIGKGLQAFGNTCGNWAQASLQYPLSVSFDAQRGLLYVADTYNDVIKQMNLQQRNISEIKTGDALHEPGGVAMLGDMLWIANTNAHEIRRVHTQTGAVEILELNEPYKEF